MLAIFSKNMAIFRFLYEEACIQFSEQDVLIILKICLNSNWPLGFLTVITSNVSARMFVQGTLDYKEEFVRYALLECENLIGRSITSKVLIASQVDEDVIREIKDRMTEHPYSSIAWLYFDPIHKELKN